MGREVLGSSPQTRPLPFASAENAAPEKKRHQSGTRPVERGDDEIGKFISSESYQKLKGKLTNKNAAKGSAAEYDIKAFNKLDELVRNKLSPKYLEADTEWMDDAERAETVLSKLDILRSSLDLVLVLVSDENRKDFSDLVGIVNGLISTLDITINNHHRFVSEPSPDEDNRPTSRPPPPVFGQPLPQVFGQRSTSSNPAGSTRESEANTLRGVGESANGLRWRDPFAERKNRDEHIPTLRGTQQVEPEVKPIDTRGTLPTLPEAGINAEVSRLMAYNKANPSSNPPPTSRHEGLKTDNTYFFLAPDGTAVDAKSYEAGGKGNISRQAHPETNPESRPVGEYSKILGRTAVPAGKNLGIRERDTVRPGKPKEAESTKAMDKAREMDTVRPGKPPNRRDAIRPPGLRPEIPGIAELGHPHIEAQLETALASATSRFDLSFDNSLIAGKPANDLTLKFDHSLIPAALTLAPTVSDINDPLAEDFFAQGVSQYNSGHPATIRTKVQLAATPLVPEIKHHVKKWEVMTIAVGIAAAVIGVLGHNVLPQKGTTSTTSTPASPDATAIVKVTAAPVAKNSPEQKEGAPEKKEAKAEVKIPIQPGIRLAQQVFTYYLKLVKGDPAKTSAILKLKAEYEGSERIVTTSMIAGMGKNERTERITQLTRDAAQKIEGAEGTLAEFKIVNSWTPAYVQSINVNPGEAKLASEFWKEMHKQGFNNVLVVQESGNANMLETELGRRIHEIYISNPAAETKNPANSPKHGINLKERLKKIQRDTQIRHAYNQINNTSTVTEQFSAERKLERLVEENWG